jgi:hypothetical protein
LSFLDVENSGSSENSVAKSERLISTFRSFSWLLNTTDFIYIWKRPSIIVIPSAAKKEVKMTLVVTDIRKLLIPHSNKNVKPKSPIVATSFPFSVKQTNHLIHKILQ